MSFDWGVLVRWEFIRYLAVGAFYTLLVSLVAQSVGLLLGLLLAFLRVSRNRLLCATAYFYIWFFRGTPLLIQLIIIYSGLPQAGIRLTIIQSAVLGLSLNSAAYIAEIFRGSFLAVDKHQLEAASIDGASHHTVMLSIVLPQSLTTAIPPLANEFIAMLKNASLASAIGLPELLFRTSLLISATYRALELYLMALVYYLIMTTVLSYIQAIIEKYISRNIV